MESSALKNGESAVEGSHSKRDRDEDRRIDALILNGKVYCANCIHCVLVRMPAGIEGQYVLRVKCSARRWKKKLGEEKIYKFFTVARRTVDTCDIYEPMGELKTYLKDLRKSLPIKDETYLG